MSHILDILSFAEYGILDSSSDSAAPSYTFLPDPFQQAILSTRTNPRQNNQFLNSIAY
jgi:hypothetical protein